MREERAEDPDDRLDRLDRFERVDRAEDLESKDATEAWERDVSSLPRSSIAADDLEIDRPTSGVRRSWSIVSSITKLPAGPESIHST